MSGHKVQANHALQRTRRERRGCNCCIPCAGSLSLGRYAAKLFANMSWMITDQSELEGTCYMEVLPGKYAGECWNPQSVFFEEEHFAYIERTIIRHCPKHDHYAFTDINRAVWENILTDLERLQKNIGDSSRLSDIREHIDLFFTTTEQRFLESEAENMKNLRQMLNAFIRWARSTLESHDTIAVLGM